MGSLNAQNTMSYENSLIDVRVIFDIYGEEGDEIVTYALGAFYTEASKYVAELYNAVSHNDYMEASRLYHSLKTMSGMIGARLLAQLCDELEMLLTDGDDFGQKYEEFQQLWPKIVTELEHYLEQ